MSILKDAGISDNQTGTVSTVMHLGANFMPGVMGGTALELGADMLDSEIVQKEIILTHLKAIYERMVRQGVQVDVIDKETGELTGERRLVQLSDLAHRTQEGKIAITDQAIALLDQHGSEALLPPVLWEEIIKARSIESKGAMFAAQTGVQVAAGALVPGGMLMGLAAGLGAGAVADPILNTMMGEEKKLTVSMILPAINQLAVQRQEHPEVPTKIDTSLVGLYQMAIHPELFKEQNNEELVQMFEDHMAAKQEDPKAITELDEYMAEHQADFTPLVPDPTKVNLSRFGTVNSLEIIAMNIQGPQDMEDMLFEPSKFQNKIALAATGALDAGRDLLAQTRINKDGQATLPPKPQTKNHSPHGHGVA